MLAEQLETVCKKFKSWRRSDKTEFQQNNKNNKNNYVNDDDNNNNNIN